MKFKSLLLLITLIFSCKNTNKNFLAESFNESTTTIYFVRHAEKDLTTKDNPELTEAGLKRAKSLSNYFSDKSIDKVYSSNFNRTLATAKPTADVINKDIIIYDLNTIKAKDFIEENTNKNVVFVGHSNTIPFFVNDIVGENIYSEIDESIYNNIFIVTITNGNITHEKIQLN